MLRRVRRSELNELAADWHFRFDESDLDEFHVLTGFTAGLLDELEARSSAAPVVAKATRDVGREAGREEDPYNAIVRWCSVKGDGQTHRALSGVKVGLKDCIAVAGIPMTCGSRLMKGFVPIRDSVVTRRLLVAGAEIVAMLNMDHFAFSGGGDTSSYGATLNPFDVTRTTGGSSAGSTAALFYDGIDVTLGSDQGGSIRAPASWTGVIGLKPTHGLVPYTGIAGLDRSMDHCGPLGRTVAEVARLLAVIAGAHDSDPRQQGCVTTQPYVEMADDAPESFHGVTFGLVEEGLHGADGTEYTTGALIRHVAEELESLGAEVRAVSVPEHARGGSLCFVSLIEGLTDLLSSGGNGYHHSGEYWPELSDAIGQGLRTHADELSHQIKLVVAFGRLPAQELLRRAVREGTEPAPHDSRKLRPSTRRRRLPRHADDPLAGPRASTRPPDLRACDARTTGRNDARCASRRRRRPSARRPDVRERVRLEAGSAARGDLERRNGERRWALDGELMNTGKTSSRGASGRCGRFRRGAAVTR